MNSQRNYNRRFYSFGGQMLGQQDKKEAIHEVSTYGGGCLSNVYDVCISKQKLRKGERGSKHKHLRAYLWMTPD